MKYLILFLSILTFSKTISYGLYEKKNSNTVGFVAITVIAIISLILPNLMLYINGNL